MALSVVVAHADVLTQSVFAFGTAIGATSRDSVTYGDGSLWVVYQNGVASCRGVGAGLPDDTAFPITPQGLFFYPDTGANVLYE